MKSVVIMMLLFLCTTLLFPQQDSVAFNTEMSEFTVIGSIRADEKTPITQKTFELKDIETESFGQELPTLLSNTQSVTSYSDAGNYYGYTYFRLRGSDQTRINFTLNGVPLNEPEDQGVYFNNFVDFTNSIESMQIQRGVGTSTNGVSSFGGSINFQSVSLSKPLIELQAGLASYNTKRYSLEYCSGIQNNTSIYIRYSDNYSDGYKYHSVNDVNTIDDSYEEEYNIAKSIGFECIFYHYDAFVEQMDKLSLYNPHKTPTDLVIYRGWMLSVLKYKELNDRLNKKELFLINNADEYKLCHHFDNSYEIIKNDVNTPFTVVCPEDIDCAYELMKKYFSTSFMMKDNVKSVKNSDFPKNIPVDIDVKYFNLLKKQFINERAHLYSGEILLKQFVNLKKYKNDTTNEWRVFYLYNIPITISRNSNQPLNAPMVPTNLIENPTLLKLQSKFYTVDFAELENGEWIVIETGDGQVSGLSPEQNILEFYTKLQSLIN